MSATASGTSSTASSESSTTSAVKCHSGLGLNLGLDPFETVPVGSLFLGMNEKISAHNLADSGDRIAVVPVTLVPMDRA